MSTDPEESVNIQIDCSPDGLEADFNKLKELARQICKRFSVNNVTVSIAVVNDEQIKKVNREFLDKENSTDVISFDLSDDSGEKIFELIVNADQAVRQSRKREHSTEAELALYVTHGLLHNLGFDDTQQDEAKKMHDKEDEILQQAGFGVIYGK